MLLLAPARPLLQLIQFECFPYPHGNDTALSFIKAAVQGLAARAAWASITRMPGCGSRKGAMSCDPASHASNKPSRNLLAGKKNILALLQDQGIWKAAVPQLQSIRLSVAIEVRHAETLKVLHAAPPSPVHSRHEFLPANGLPSSFVLPRPANPEWTGF